MEANSWTVRKAALAIMVAVSLCAVTTLARAGLGESDVPETTVVPSDEGAAPPPAKQGAPSPAPRKSEPPALEHSAPSRLEIEPAQARVKLLNDTPVLSQPSKSSKTIETAHAGKFIEVTGSTHYFLQVSLKSGQTGYIDPSAVELVRPTDKIFALTSDAAVLEKPNKWSKKLSEVHKGHDVHVIGVALNYTKIKMKSGLEGYIPMSALE